MPLTEKGKDILNKLVEQHGPSKGTRMFFGTEKQNSTLQKKGRPKGSKNKKK